MGHSEVVMCDFAACLLAELERWMLNASPAMIDLNSFADNSDYFSAPTSALEEVSKRLYSDVVCSCCCETTFKLCAKIAPVLHRNVPCCSALKQDFKCTCSDLVCFAAVIPD